MYSIYGMLKCAPGPMATLEANAAVPRVICEEGRFCLCDQRSICRPLHRGGAVVMTESDPVFQEHAACFDGGTGGGHGVAVHLHAWREVAVRRVALAAPGADSGGSIRLEVQDAGVVDERQVIAAAETVGNVGVDVSNR